MSGTDELCYLEAATALRLFRDRALSPVELMAAVIARAEATEPAIHALTYRYFDEAMSAAKAAEARYAGKGARPRPLEGLPVAIKDAGHIRGKATSAGSLTADETPQAKSSPINARVLRAGAIAHARSATPEFSCASVTQSRRWGVTRNPWNPEFTPGGSSGGAGAALAVGTTTLATGSDIGGSIRIPAACCGVVGLKPSRGRNPVDAPFFLDPYCHTGPMARSVGDVVLLQNVMCGPHPDDPMTLRPKQRLAAEYPPISGWRIGWSADLGAFDAAPEVRAGLMAALDLFGDLGAEVVEIKLPWDASIIDAALIHLRHIFGASLADTLEAAGDQMTGYARDFAMAGRASSARDYLKSLEITARAGQVFAAAISDCQVFLCPTTCVPALPAAFDASQDIAYVSGMPVDPMIGWVMTAPFNMLSRHPVLAVPSGAAPNGVPIGIQIVGHPFRDQDVIRAGLAYEAAAGGWYRRPDQRPPLAPSNR